MSEGNVLRHPPFLRVLAGSAAALLGDQFTAIAIPWLVLRLTKDSLVLGTVVACMGVPRVIFLLLAGVLVDRYSPRTILIVVSFGAAVVLGGFGALVLSGNETLGMLYGFAVLMGLVGTFTVPARIAILPRVVAPEQLQQANSIMMSVTQLSILVGPVLAGILVSTTNGLGIAFMIDGVCFLIAAFTMPRLMRSAEPSGDATRKSMLAEVFEGFRWLWRDHVLRLLIAYWIMAAFVAMGTIQVGLPLLVKEHLGLTSAAFGSLIAAEGVGQLLGLLLSGLRGMKKVPLGIAVCLTDVLVGLMLAGMGVNHTLIGALALMLAVGAGVGYVQVGLYTWIQHRIPGHLLGRIASIMTLAMTSLAPVSALLAGTFIHYVTVAAFFAGAGTLLSCLALLALCSPTIRGVRALQTPPGIDQREEAIGSESPRVS